jgi:glutamate-ammonia-ligase adenylyltransferase
MSLFQEYFSQFVPDSLNKESQEAVEKLVENLDKHQYQRLQKILDNNSKLAAQLMHAIVGSDYVLGSCCRNPDLLFHWLLVDVPFEPLTAVKIFDGVDSIDNDCDLDELDKHLRRLRRQFMVGLYWRDLNRLADFFEVGQAMTSMAEAFIQKALDFHYRQLAKKYGMPIGKDSGQPQPMLVIGMGKLGGNELNVSSDIDLIFVYPEGGSTDHAARAIDNQKFFNQLGQRLIKTLNEVTEDGFVFRVDMRLRPYGQSGALASSYAALENYYQTQGRDWERFAYIKARVVASANLPQQDRSIVLQEAATEEFYKILQPFVYRKYVDFSTIDSLRQLKEKIVQEVQRRGLQDDVKLGAGGIREVEFIAQSFQLIRGGKDRHLQERHLLTTLQKLSDTGDLSEAFVEKLSQAYLFLRKTEHAIQAMYDKQTQRLPGEDRAQKILAWIMGFDHWGEFLTALEKYRQVVSNAFEEVVSDNEGSGKSEEAIVPEWSLFWQSPNPSTFELLENQSIQQAQVFIEAVTAFKNCRNVQSLSAAAQIKLDQLMPRLLSTCAQMDNPDVAIKQVLGWLEAIVTRTSYLLLLIENPQILKLLITLFVGSSWVAETLTKMPSLLDELLHPESLYSLPNKSSLQDELRQRLLRLEADDIESHMEALRYFKLAHNLHVAASEVAERLPLMKISDYLTFTAEVVLEQVLLLAWGQLVKRHGYPEGSSDQSPNFLIVGYGKLGGIEMSYSSDLDLVFIYDADIQGMTNGDKPLDNQTFYTRLGQKIIHILNTRTLSGQLYEVDMRLRPSGNSGLLVSSLASYSRYQKQEAWIWEHQALVRARAVAGDVELADRFMALRKELLCTPRQTGDLKSEVIKMREKMREHLGTTPKKHGNSAENQDFHLKQDAGGIVDIEFMVQYAVLAWSADCPAICEWTDNIRIIEALQRSKFLKADDANQLISIYKSYRQYSHRLTLQQKTSSVVEGEFFVKERRQVIAMWDNFFH